MLRGTALETSNGAVASLHIYCTIPNLVEETELFGPLWLAEDIDNQEPVKFRVPHGPGFGVNLDEEKVKRYRRAR